MSSFTPRSQIEDGLAYDQACHLYERRTHLEDEYTAYLNANPELQDVLHDFMQAVLIHRPEDSLSYAKHYFTKMKTQQ